MLNGHSGLQHVPPPFLYGRSGLAQAPVVVENHRGPLGKRRCQIARSATRGLTAPVVSIAWSKIEAEPGARQTNVRLASPVLRESPRQPD